MGIGIGMGIGWDRVILDGNGRVATLKEHTYNQTCLKGSPKGRKKSGCLRQVTP